MFNSQRSGEAPFLRKTYQLVDDPTTDDVISWNETGNAFVIWKTADFAKDLLPNYFKHSNFSSFVRQLNTYGFRKTVPEKWEFANDYFNKGQKELLYQIRRRRSGKPINDGRAFSISNGDDVGSTSASSPGPKDKGPVVNAAVLTARVEALVQENEKLKMENERLMAEKERAEKHCAGLMALVADYVGPGSAQMRCLSSHNATCDSQRENSGKGLKLFGVVVDKRGREGEVEDNSRCKEIKIYG